MKKIAVVLAAMVLTISAVIIADSVGTNFESFSAGAVNGQDGWSSLGSVGSGCAVYDVAVVPNTFGFRRLGQQALRISNAITSGCFGDQTFSKPLVNEAGEATAQNGGFSGGVRSQHFTAEWDFASAMPDAQQLGLSVTMSPDRGDGGRMSWLNMSDQADGLALDFYDYQRGATVDPLNCCPPFVGSHVATKLDRHRVHHVKMVVDLLDGPSNDVVWIILDGKLIHTGTTWEDYFRDNEGGFSRTVDSALFRVGGASASNTLGYGFLIDNVKLTSGTPSFKDQCKGTGWKSFGNPKFKNQGQCTDFVEDANHDNHDHDRECRDDHDRDRRGDRDDR